MTTTKILLLGHTGMLGTYVKTYFAKTDIPVVCINYRVSLEEINLIEATLLEHGLDEKSCVVNCIGQIPQRTDLDSNYYVVNGLFPHVLSKVCKKYGANMIQPTTDCVYSGKRFTGNYVETDIHDETGNYGVSKSVGEPPDCTVIRTSIIGLELQNKKSFMEWVINSLKEGKNINCWANHHWNGITCLQYCKIIEKIVREQLFWKGIRHIYSPVSKSKYQLAQIIAETFDLNDELINKSLTAEPVNKTLSSIYPALFEIPDLTDQVKETYGYSPSGLRLFNLPLSL